MANSYPISRWSSELTGERRKMERKKKRKERSVRWLSR